MHTDYARAYLRYLGSTRKLSPNTVRAYAVALERYERFLERRGVSIERTAAADVQAYISELKASGSSIATRRHRASVIRQFYRFLIEHELIDGFWRNPAKLVSIERQRRAPAGVLTPEQFERFVDFAPRNFSTIRDLAIFETLFATGCRISELVSADLEDLDLAGKTLMIRHAKGRKQRLSFLNGSAAAALERYLPHRTRRVAKGDSDAKFALVLNGHGHRISTRGVFWTINDRVKVLRRGGVELPARIGPHTFRHSFATALFANGAPIEVIQKLLGHSSLKTSAAYIHPPVQDLKQVYEQSHPHAKKTALYETEKTMIGGSHHEQEGK